MDIYINFLCDLAAYIKKKVQLSNTHIFKGGGSGLGCLLTLDNIEPAGPIETGRELLITVEVYAPMDNWKQLLTTLGRLEQAFMNCQSEDNELKVKYHLSLGAWSRTEDESNIIFKNSLTVNGVRININ